MPVQINRVNRMPTTSEQWNQALSQGAEAYSNYQQLQAGKQQMNQFGQQYGIPNLGELPPEIQKEIVSKTLGAGLKQETPLQKEQRLLAEQRRLALQSQQKRFSQIFPGQENPESKQHGMNSQEPGMQSQNPLQNYSDQQLQEISAYKGQPGEMGIYGNEADRILNERKENKKIERQTYESERGFHTGYSKKYVEEADELRSSIPKLEMSLDFARNAVESGEVGAFSLANLGERLNIHELQTAKGAQLVTAAKENLLGNMSRVSSRAQNKWFEQRLNSMMAKVGQSEEANLSAQEMLESEVALNKAYLNEFDRISEEDMKNYGYERKDIKKRAQQAVKPLENHIFNRANYRLKEIEERESGLDAMKKRVGKNVIKGEPLTLAMAKLYKDKFGDKALQVAEKNGYSIPTIEEFKSYQQRPREFREELQNE